MLASGVVKAILKEQYHRVIHTFTNERRLYEDMVHRMKIYGEKDQQQLWDIINEEYPVLEKERELLNLLKGEDPRDLYFGPAGEKGVDIQKVGYPPVLPIGSNNVRK